MWSYWSRVLGAWLLLRLASLVLKDAEKLLRETSTAKTDTLVVDAEVVE